MTTEEMKAELEAAGYSVRLQVRGSYIRLPFNEDVFIGGVIIQALENDTNGLIRYAYTHLQKERQFEAMIAFVDKVAKTETIDKVLAQDEHAMIYSEHPKLKELVEEAKKLIGDGE